MLTKHKVYEDFTHSEKMYLNSKKGVGLFGACDIKQLRIYDRALDHEEILLNHLADMPIQQQRERYKFNFENSTTPEIRLYGDISRMSNTIPANVRLKYTSPNSELYGESINFSTEASEMLVQGTSSLQYILKNFTIYLKDDNLMDYYYTPYRNGIPENVYCFKADYSESSHGRNVGIAKFTNDCLYDTLTPAQTKDPRYRNASNNTLF